MPYLIVSIEHAKQRLQHHCDVIEGEWIDAHKPDVLALLTDLAKAERERRELAVLREWRERALRLFEGTDHVAVDMASLEARLAAATKKEG